MTESVIAADGVEVFRIPLGAFICGCTTPSKEFGYFLNNPFTGEPESMMCPECAASRGFKCGDIIEMPTDHVFRGSPNDIKVIMPDHWTDERKVQCVSAIANLLKHWGARAEHLGEVAT